MIRERMADDAELVESLKDEVRAHKRRIMKVRESLTELGAVIMIPGVPVEVAKAWREAQRAAHD